MFFNLGKRKSDNFPNHTRIGAWWLSHDNGWSVQPDESAYKGYRFDDINHGNFIKIYFENNQIKILHDLERSFPLWWDPISANLNNISGPGQQIWADETIYIEGLTCTVTKIPVQYNVVEDTLTLDQVSNSIADLTAQKFAKLNTLPGNRKLFLTGGIDTATLYAVMNDDPSVELIDYEYFAYDNFTNKNISNIRTAANHWGYLQIHHWIDPTVLITGGCGDEYFMRGPDAVAKYMAWHDFDLVALLESVAGYHVGYYLLDKNRRIFDNYYKNRAALKAQFPTYNDLATEIINNNLNDHQHWHLGNTLTFTPFKDINITLLMLQLSFDDMLAHVIDATVNKNIISKFNKSILQNVSLTKNIDTRYKLM